MKIAFCFLKFSHGTDYFLIFQLEFDTITRILLTNNATILIYDITGSNVHVTISERERESESDPIKPMSHGRKS